MFNFEWRFGFELKNNGGVNVLLDFYLSCFSE